MADERAAEELIQFLRVSAKPELKIAAIKHVSGMTGGYAGVAFILKHKDLLEAVFSLLKDKIQDVVDDSYKAVINITANENAVERIISDYDIIPDLIKNVCDPKSRNADEACKILSNLTRKKQGSSEFLKRCETKSNTDQKDDSSIKNTKLQDLIDIFCKTKFNEHSATLDHIASILANISQIEKGRTLLLEQSIGQLLPFLKPNWSLTRRRGISSTIKNCCFEHEHHERLLSQDVDILPHILLPLAGPEEFEDYETESLPLDLQYLPDDKERDPDPEIRRTLLASVLLLCADKFGRNFLKDAGTYYIIRELHMWELEHGPEENGEECEKVVQILIADEPEPGMENLMKIPEEQLKEFKTVASV